MQKLRRKLIIYVIFIGFSVFHGTTSERPVITKRPSTKTVYLNKSTTFVCQVHSSLPFVIEWRRMNGGQLLQNVSGYVLVFNDTLTFLHARRSDNGVYKCTARNSVGSSSAEATLIVLDPPVEPTITEISANQTIVEGERVTFTCKATGNPLPQITWKIFLESGSNNAAQLERPSPQSIRLPSASPRDAGQYVCIAENIAGNDTEVVYLNVLGYPVFIVSPASNITVHENATVKLNCKVIGSPIPDVTWYYNDKPANEISNVVVLSNNTLLISYVKFNNSGRYTCMANNSAGLQRSRNSLLQVKRKPRLDCCPYESTVRQNQKAIEGKSVSLYCSAAGYPKPEYQWMFENRTISSFSVLTISNVSKRSEGVYLCMVHNNLGEVMLIVHLNVLVPPKVSVQPREATVVEGEQVVFSCTVSGVPLPTVTWYSSKGVILRNNTLMISNVSTNDQGEYTCEAKNEAGQKTVRVRLIVAVRPTFLSFPRYISVNETSSVNIQCAARGPNQPIIRWYRQMTNGQKIKLNYSGNEFTITNANRSVGGIYVCEARNYAGCINTTIFLNVQYAPYALTYEQKNIVAGKQAILHCPVNSNPAAEIQWITPVRFKGASLTITKVNISHAGQYSCRGRNFLGTTDAFLQVQVLAPPRIVDLKMVEFLNDIVSLSCVTTGAPKSSVEWIDLTPLSPSSFNVQNGNLRIERRYISSMTFLCNASNVYGWMTKYVAVPSSPHNFTISKTSATSVQFSWLHNDSEITSSFIVERRSVSDWVTINSSIVSPWFEDQNLTPFTKFIYRVSAKNALGLSKPSGTFNIRTKEGVPSSPSKLEAKLVTLTSIRIHWEPPGKPRGQLTNIIYEIYYKESTARPKNEVNITVKATEDHVLKIQKLKSNTLYTIRIRAGRQIDGGVLQWSNYKSIPIRTLQEAPRTAPEEIKVVSNGPRRIYVTWKRSPTYVEGYKLQYKRYESTNMTTIVIKSWNMSSYIITGLKASQYYDVRLNMFTTGGDGPWSHPHVVRTETDRLGLPGPITNSSDSLPWKIAVGGSAFLVFLLLLLLVYIYLMRKSNHKRESDPNRKKKKGRRQGGYDFSDNVSGVSNESEGSTEGVYNVNIQNDHIDLSMFDNSLHTNVAPEHMYVENPILPTSHDDSDDSYEAVRLATFIARPSPHPTPHLTGRRQLSASHMNSAYDQNEDDDIIDMCSNHARTTEIEQSDEDGDIPVYAQVDLAKKERDRKNQDNSRLEQLSDDILI